MSDTTPPFEAAASTGVRIAGQNDGFVQFETPENVQVSYAIAGLGTRFVAWVIDFALIWFVIFLLLILAGIGAAASGEVERDFERALKLRPGEMPEIPMYILGIFAAIVSFSTFFYFGLSELFMRGQTFGKRRLKIRVVKADGFSLDAGAILLRTIFRVIDHLPPVWLVPLLSKKGQRLGDMIAGTILIKEEIGTINPLRERLLNSDPAARVFQFSAPTLTRARPIDIEAVEKFLERAGRLQPHARETLLMALCNPLARRMQVDPPDEKLRHRFLEDFLTAEYRRQYRQLG